MFNKATNDVPLLMGVKRPVVWDAKKQEEYEMVKEVKLELEKCRDDLAAKELELTQLKADSKMTIEQMGKQITELS